MLKKIYYFLCICLIAIKPIFASESLETVHEKLSVTELNDAQFENFIQTADKPVIVDFWATWCNPCIKMKPVFEQLASEFKDQYLFVSVNIDEGQQTAAKYGITSIPAFKIIKENAVIGTFMGYATKEKFIEQINNAIDKKLTLNTLLSAIQANDKELVASCLAQEKINVNGMIQMDVLNTTMPMTPLIMASTTVIFGQTSLEIVSMLLKAGAQIDQEIDAPTFDKAIAVTGSEKTSARIVTEQIAKGKSEKELAAIDNDTTKQKLSACKAKALSLLELFQKSS